MGNNSSAREGGEEWEQQQLQMADPEDGSYRRGLGPEDLMAQSPPHNPRAAIESPLLFTPQTPMAPLQRPTELNFQNNPVTQNSTEYEDLVCEQGVPTIITWCHGGEEVAVAGSWDNWKKKESLQKSGKDFTILKVLPSGFYQFRFIVDGNWRHAPDLKWIHDEAGITYNVLDLQPFVPDDIESIAAFDLPQSPESSYNSCTLDSEDYAKEPPLAPPHLSLTLLDTPDEESPCSLSRPQHVVLNHLYIQKPKGRQPVVALGETHRFRGKYVTVVLFKSLQR